MFSQCWVVSLEKQDKDFQTEKKKKDQYIFHSKKQKKMEDLPF